MIDGPCDIDEVFTVTVVTIITVTNLLKYRITSLNFVFLIDPLLTTLL